MIGNRRHPARRRDERGAAMVEFALIAPLFIALVFAVISYGYMLSYRQGMSQAAAEGARSIAVAPASASDLAGSARAAVNRSLSSYGVTCTSGGALTHSGRTVGSCTVPAAASACPAPNPSSARCATVTIVHDYRQNPLIPSFPGLGITLPDRLSYSSTMEAN